MIGGLSAADVSTDGIVRIGPSGSARNVGRLPSPLTMPPRRRSRPALPAGRRRRHPQRRDPPLTEGGGSANAGRLPVAASDVSAATIGSTAYVVGGYTGTSALRSIVAFSPGHPARVVATLPRPLRYASVAAVGRDVLIAGGTSGTSARRRGPPLPARRQPRRHDRTVAPCSHARGRCLFRWAVLRDRRSRRPARLAVAGNLGGGPGHREGAGRGEAADGALRPRCREWAAGDPPGRRPGCRRPRERPDHEGGERRALGRARTGPRHGSPAGPPGSRPLLSRHDVYAADRAGRLSPRPPLPGSASTCRTARATRSTRSTRAPFKIVRHFATGALPQHVTPSYDLKTLWVDNDEGNSLTPIDPRTGKPGKPVPGRRSVQPLLHARRPVRDRRRRAPAAARLPRRPLDEAAPLAARADVPGRRPHGLHGRTAATRSRAASSAAA